MGRVFFGFKVLERGFMGRYPCLFKPQKTERQSQDFIILGFRMLARA